MQNWLIQNTKLETYADVHNKVTDSFVSHRYNGIKLPKWAESRYGAIFYSLKVVLATGRGKTLDGANLLRWVRRLFCFIKDKSSDSAFLSVQPRLK